ncbi:hypothetical protein ERN12_12865 [Rhodobacteraceae bacterium]|nr:hypothetical protein ERN12_12865 [Paracoccaceae bacterium]
MQPIVLSKGPQTRSFNEDGKTVTDPHVWHSVTNVWVWANNIEAALIRATAEASAADAAKLFDQIKAEGMNVCFLEKYNDSRQF